MVWLAVGAALLVGYLLGSAPTAWLAARYLIGRAGVDIRQRGDGNAGAGNIGHLYGGRWGYLVGAVDIGKGAAAVLAGDLLSISLLSGDWPAGRAVPGMVAGIAAVAGHIWPVWLGFRGGRGAATAVGVTGGVLTLPTLALALPALLLLLVSRNTTLTLAFMCVASLAAGKAVFGAGWLPVGYCGGVFLAAGAAHWWSVRFRRAAAAPAGTAASTTPPRACC